MRRIKSLLIISLISLFFSCGTVMVRVEERPDWSLLTARIDQGKLLIDSMGSAEDRDEALVLAGVSWDEILIRSIGIPSSDNNELTEPQKSFLEKLEMERNKALDSAKTGKGIISLENINYKQDKGSDVELYLQCSLSLEDYADLKKEADSLFEITNPLYEEREELAGTSAESGDLFHAASLYLEAAVLSLENLPLNGDIFFNRYILEASGLLSRLTLTPVNLPEEALVESSLTTPVSVDVQSGGVPFIILFDQESPGGEIKKRKAQLSSKSGGLLPFYYPTPSEPGDYNLTISFNKEVLPKDEGLPSYCSESLSLLYKAAERLAFEHSISFYRDLKQISTLIVSRESDIAGNDLPSQWTSQELEKALQEKGYSVSFSEIESRFISQRNSEELIRDLRHLYRDDYQRILLLETRITEFKQNQDLFVVSASCSLKVINLIKGTVTSDLNDETSITLQDQRNMLPSVFTQLGRKMAENYSR